MSKSRLTFRGPRRLRLRTISNRIVIAVTSSSGNCSAILPSVLRSHPSLKLPCCSIALKTGDATIMYLDKTNIWENSTCLSTNPEDDSESLSSHLSASRHSNQKWDLRWKQLPSPLLFRSFQPPPCPKLENSLPVRVISKGLGPSRHLDQKYALPLEWSPSSCPGWDYVVEIKMKVTRS